MMEISSQAAILRRVTKRRPHVVLKWDVAQNKVVAERTQVGLSWRQACSDGMNVMSSSSYTRLVDNFDVPEELFELPDLKNVLTVEAWEAYLSESERDLLSIYLPEGVDQKSTLQALMAGENFHFGNLLHEWGASVCAGAMHPDALLQRELKVEKKQKASAKNLRSYHSNMVNNLQWMKRVWQECDNPEDLLLRIGRVPRSAQRSQHHIIKRTFVHPRLTGGNIESGQHRLPRSNQTRQDHLIRNGLEPPKSTGAVIDTRHRLWGDISPDRHEEKDTSIRHKAKRQKVKMIEEGTKVNEKGTKRPTIKPTEEGTKRTKMKASEEARDVKEGSNSDFEREWFQKYVEVTVGPLSGAKLSNGSLSVKVTKKLFMEVKLRIEAGQEVHLDTLYSTGSEFNDLQASKKVGGSSSIEEELIAKFWKSVVLKDVGIAHAKFVERKEQQLKLTKALAVSCKKGVSILHRVQVDAFESVEDGLFPSEDGLEETRGTTSKFLSHTEDNEKPFVNHWFGKHLLAGEVVSASGCSMHDQHAFESASGKEIHALESANEKEIQRHCIEVRWDENIKEGLCSPVSMIPEQGLQDSSLNHMPPGQHTRGLSSVMLPRCQDHRMEHHTSADTDGLQSVRCNHTFEHDTNLISRHQCDAVEDQTGLFKQGFGAQDKPELNLLAGGHVELQTRQHMDMASNVGLDARQFLTVETSGSHQYSNPLASLMGDSQQQPHQSFLQLQLPLLQRQYPNYSLPTPGSLPLPVPGVDLTPFWPGSIRHSAGGALPQFGGHSWSSTDSSVQWGMADTIQNSSFRSHLQFPPSTEVSVRPRWDLSGQDMYNDTEQMSRRPEQFPDQQQPFYTDWSSRHELPSLNDTGGVLYRTSSWYPPSPFENVGAQIQHSAFNHHRLWPSETGPPKAVPQLWGGSMDCQPTS